ncbi:cell division protein DivIVA [Boudabousia tangfeifanii]|uniref:Cell division protein DivIVA n=1 Tax=Boudabousia tangfeifanii TaxID=1912795 RepID=A0A1D9MKU0_9ACTO|nr:DivIVA domain-containing protein [Boudabousia tangfeifanii]AOZ72770.1 cell division protein DivIVA [Boudabousia tangfeifanii]
MSDMFNKVGGLRRGYSVAAVNQFMADAKVSYEGKSAAVNAAKVLSVVFPDEKGGYDRVQVDATLDRLASAFIKRDRAEFVSRHGQQAWLDRVAERATTLYPRLLRPVGERFVHPGRGQLGYSAESVDPFLDLVSAFFNEGKELTANQVRTVVFKAARGKKAYEESVVDAYLNRVLEVLLAVE